MGRRIIFCDDLDPKLEAEVSITFGIDNDVFEIDVTKAHEAELRDVLASWIKVARKVDEAHVPFPTEGDRRKEIEARRDRKAQDKKIYEWALRQGEDITSQLKPLGPGGAIPYMKKDTKAAYSLATGEALL